MSSTPTDPGGTLPWSVHTPCMAPRGDPPSSLCVGVVPLRLLEWRGGSGCARISQCWLVGAEDRSEAAPAKLEYSSAHTALLAVPDPDGCVHRARRHVVISIGPAWSDAGARLPGSDGLPALEMAVEPSTAQAGSSAV